MIELDEATLLAYVDGQLDETERRAVESALAVDLRAQEIVRQLRLTPPGLREAFDATLQRPLPPKLTELVLKSAVPRSPARRVPLAYAAGLALSLLVVGLGAGYVWRSTQAPVAGVSQPWLLAVAEYQALYARETVEQTEPAAVSATQRRLSRSLGMSLPIPDLSAHGLAFKRGQLLEFQGRPLAQLVYLPRDGRPIAYCVMSDAGRDLAPTAGEAKGLRYFHWRRGGYGYIVIGDADRDELRQIALAAYATLGAGGS